MKKGILSLLILAAVCQAAVAQKTINDANAEKRNVGAFHAVEVSSGIDLYLSSGNEETVVVSASEARFRDRIRTEVKNGVLKIWYDFKSGLWISGNKKMRAYVSFKELDKVSGSGGSDVFVDGVIRSGKLDLQVSGGSDFNGKVNIDDLKVNASGGSDVHISGEAKNLTVKASGGSDFKGYDLAADICDLQASGGSDIYVTVNKEMTVEASGGSDVYYKGTGLIREIRSGGSSGIKKVTK